VDDRDRLLLLVQRLYAAPGRSEGWEDFLLDLRTSLSGTAASFVSHHFVRQQGSVSLTAGLDPEAVNAYQRYWSAFDPWACSPVTRTLTSGSVVPGDHLVMHADVRRTRFYNDYGRHHDVVRCIVGTIEAERDAVSVLSVNRSDAGEPFDRQEAALLGALMPHLHRAVQLHRRLADAQALADGSTAALNRLAHGVILIDALERVMLANRTAEEILCARDGLSVHNRALFGARAQDTNALRTLIVEAVATSIGEGFGAGGLVTLGRPSGRAALRVLVTPVARRNILFGPAEAAACIFVTDPERFPLPSSAHVQQAFGLTAAETRVAMAMLDGKTVEQLAEELSISRNTARTHLQRLFAKNQHRASGRSDTRSAGSARTAAIRLAFTRLEVCRTGDNGLARPEMDTTNHSFG
jgi:DNA-binding CsgD family transcriptional regulator